MIQDKHRELKLRFVKAVPTKWHRLTVKVPAMPGEYIIDGKNLGYATM